MISKAEYRAMYIKRGRYSKPHDVTKNEYDTKNEIGRIIAHELTIYLSNK
jgi:hypothetical protein